MKKLVSALLISGAVISAPAFAAGAADWSAIPVGTKAFNLDIGSVSYWGAASGLMVGVSGDIQITPFVGIEFGYQNFGSGTIFTSNNGFTTTTDKAKGSSFQFLATGNYQVSPEFSAYAKAGIAMNKTTVTWTTTQNSNGAVLSTGTSALWGGNSNNIMFAIGAKYKVANGISLRAQYEDLGWSSINAVSVGAQFSF